eukprot:SAG11_NODE_34245_length_273_cov_0.591954_2_plen_21_part_01
MYRYRLLVDFCVYTSLLLQAL